MTVTAVVALVQTAAMLGRRGDWQGVWADTAGVFGQSLIVLLPVAVALFTWLQGRVRQTSLGVLSVTSSLGDTRVGLRQVAELSAAAVVGLGGAGTACGIITARYATYGGPDLLALASTGAWMTVAAAIGNRLAAVRPYTIAAPTAGVAVYVALAWWISNYDSFAATTPLDWRSMALHRQAAWVSMLQVYVAVALAVLIVTTYRRPRARAATATASITVLAAAGLLLAGAPSSRIFDAASAELTCVDTADGLEICNPRSFAYRTQPFAKAWSRVDAAAPGLTPADAVYINDYAAGLDAATDLTLQVQLQTAGERSVILGSDGLDLSGKDSYSVDEITALVIDGLVPSISEANELVRMWAYRSAQLPLDGEVYQGGSTIDPSIADRRPVEASWFDALDDGARQEWFEQHRRDLRDGSLTWSDFTDE